MGMPLGSGLPAVASRGGRRLVLAAAMAGLIGAGCGGPDPPPATPGAAPPATSATTTGPEPAAGAAKRAGEVPRRARLPGGGRRVFPDHRVVAYYGAAQTPLLGVLGETAPEVAARRLRQRARGYERADRPVMPAFELIATIANAQPGPSGLYRTRTPHETIRRYLEVARRHQALLLLDVQPGRGDFLTEVRFYEPLLREPDVSLAIDPEWSMGSRGVPGERIGSTDAATINRVSAWLDDLVRRHDLPQKLLVVHQFTQSMVRDKEKVAPRKGLAITFHIDGFGVQEDKKRKYDLLAGDRRWHNGFKLFLDEDTGLMTPDQVMRLRPAPDLITYQ
jgi:hypothetical protein